MSAGNCNLHPGNRAASKTSAVKFHTAAKMPCIFSFETTCCKSMQRMRGGNSRSNAICSRGGILRTYFTLEKINAAVIIEI